MGSRPIQMLFALKMSLVIANALWTHRNHFAHSLSDAAEALDTEQTAEQPRGLGLLFG